MTTSNDTPDYVEIPLTRGFIALVDKQYAVVVNQFRWCEHSGYAERTAKLNKKQITVKMHRFIMELHLGRVLNRNEEVDHIHQNKLDNRISELRIATLSQNRMNRTMYRNNKSGFKGVYQERHSGNWTASIRINRKTIHLGTFSTPELAYEAYCKAAKHYHGEFACF